jgi:hypothetical protein
LRVQSERLELPAPFGWRIAQPLDSDASRQAAFNRCPNEARCEENQRNGHVDLTLATFLVCGDLSNIGDRARNDLVKRGDLGRLR